MQGFLAIIVQNTWFYGVFYFDKDVYGNRVEVKLLHFLRQEMKFENIEALKKQMESDASFAKEMFML